MNFVQYDYLAAQGDDFAAQGQYDQAIIAYRSALALMPPDRDDALNKIYAKIYTSLGDAYRSQQRWYQAQNCYNIAVKNTLENSRENVYACFCYGQSLLENNKTQQAASYLLKAFRLQRNLFDGQDGKYYACIATQVEEEQAREDAQRRAAQQEILREQNQRKAMAAPKAADAEKPLLTPHVNARKGFFSSLFKH